MEGERKRAAKIDDDDVCAQEEHCVGCLPVELVVIIISYLSVVDLLSFRCVCKCWRSAFHKCPPQSTARYFPWFVLLRIKEFEVSDIMDEDQPPLLYTMGKFGDLSTQRIYTTSDNGFEDSHFFLSKHGWLMLFQNQTLFFFNPISRQRIDLPYLQEERFLTAERNAVFDISASPTSSECMVFLINWGVGRLNYEISTCRRGDSAWITKVYASCYKSRWARPLRVVYSGNKWFCLHTLGLFSVFDPVTFNWTGLTEVKCYIFPNLSYMGSADFPVSYVIKYGDKLHLHVHVGMPYEVVLEEPLEANFVKRSEAWYEWLGDMELSFRTCIKAALLKIPQLEDQPQLQVDSFNMHAWCTPEDSSYKEPMKFHWHLHRSFVDESHRRDNIHCPRDNNCNIVVWFQPDVSSSFSSSTQPWVSP